LAVQLIPIDGWCRHANCSDTRDRRRKSGPTSCLSRNLIPEMGTVSFLYHKGISFVRAGKLLNSALPLFRSIGEFYFLTSEGHIDVSAF
jgi:hypothetical protein